MIHPVVQRAGACGYRRWVFIGVTGVEVFGLFPAVWGLSEAQHLVYLLLMEEEYKRADPKETKDAGEAILYLHDALIVVISEVLDQVRGDKRGRGGVLTGGGTCC